MQILAVVVVVVVVMVMLIHVDVVDNVMIIRAGWLLSGIAYILTNTFAAASQFVLSRDGYSTLAIHLRVG